MNGNDPTMAFSAEKRSCGGLRQKGLYKKSAPGKPLVSVITTVLNGKAHLEDTIRSVAIQSYCNIEHIIVDGGSRDGTLTIISGHEDTVDYWISEHDDGMYEALNKGVRLSRGEILTFLNSDDYLNGDRAIETVVNELENSRDTDWCYCDVRVSNEEKESHIYRIPQYNWKALLALDWCYIPHPGSFFRREIFDRFGLFDERYGLVGDYEFFLRIGKTTTAKHLTFSPVTYRQHSDQLTERGAVQRRIEHRKVQGKFGSSRRMGLRIFRAFLLMTRFRLLNQATYRDKFVRRMAHLVRCLYST
jgi:glycosyltransferase involved in cell wall biosynthesis